MKAFKKPLVALILCIAVILISTCLNVRIGLDKKYDKVCDRLYSSVLEFASDNGMKDLEIQARTSLSSGNYSSLIDEFNIFAVGYDQSETSSVDKAIKAYSSFMHSIKKFPAKQFISLLNISF